MESAMTGTGQVDLISSAEPHLDGASHVSDDQLRDNALKTHFLTVRQIPHTPSKNEA